MRFLTVRATSFGPLSAQKLEFMPGLNVIWGRNESGKSTWHAAMYVSLCGVRRVRGPGRVQDREFRERHRPWDGDSWRVEGEIELGDGRKILLEHDLDGKFACRATVLHTGRDVSNEIIRNNDNPDGSRWLELDRDAFLATACIKQADLIAVTAEPAQLQAHMQRAADTLGRQGTAAEALQRLEEFRRNNVGRDHVNRPLRQARQRLEGAQQGLDRARVRHANQQSVIAEIERLASELRSLEGRQKGLQALRALSIASQQRLKLNEALELAQAFPNGPPSGIESTDEAANAVATSLATWQSIPATPVLAGETSQQLQERIDELPDAPSGDLVPDPRILDLAARLNKLAVRVQTLDQTQPPAEDQPTYAGDPRRLRELADTLSTVEIEVDSVLVERVARSERDAQQVQAKARAITGTTVLVAVIAGAAAFAWVHAVVGLTLLGVGVLFAALAVRSSARSAATLAETARVARQELERQRLQQDEVQRRRAAAGDECQRLELASDPEALRQLANATDKAALSKEEHDKWERMRADVSGEIDKLESELRAALLEKGISEDQPAQTLTAKYIDECRENADVANKASQREELKLRLADRVSLEQGAAGIESRRNAACDGLVSCARAVGLAVTDQESTTEVVGNLQSWLEARAQRLELNQDLHNRWQQLQTLLDNRSLEEFSQQVAALEGEAGTLSEGLDVASQTQSSVQAIDLEIGELQGGIDDCRTELGMKSGELTEMRRVGGVSVSEAEEEVAAATQQLERVRDLDTILQLTIDFLKTAQERVHGDIAPVLVRSVANLLPRVTNDRYHEVQVDPQTLDVKIRPTGGQFHSATLHSRGTAEVVYLLLRMALAEHLTRPGESCPLLLDDVTVQCDRERTYAVMEALLEIAGRHQVVAFSQELEVLEWARATLRGDRDQLVELSPA